VKLHEAFSLDTAQKRFWWMDHFLGDQLKDEWNNAGTGSAVVVDAQTGGIVRITTGALTGNAHRIDWNLIRSLHVDQRVTMEIRAKLNQTAQTTARFSLRVDGTNRIVFYFSITTNPNWIIICVDGGALTQFDSGVVADTDYHIFRIECFPTGEVHFYIDGVECANSPITTNIPDGAGDYLQPYPYISTLEDVAKSMDIDYVAVRQER
jgi:hypothetical protein